LLLAVLVEGSEDGELEFDAVILVAYPKIFRYS
jgi:hypothetical protein